MNWKCTLLLIISAMCIGVESISNGTFVSIKEAPFYVYIFLSNQIHCGGSIISEYWIVTAAHCLNTFRGFDNIVITIRTGSSTKPTNGNYYVEKVILDREYTPNSIGTERRDISLIKLSEPIVFNEFQQPIQITQHPPKDGEKSTIYGIGSQGPTRTETLVLKKMELDIINKEECRSIMGYTYNLQSDVFCVGNNLTIPCPGDSGGPIVVDGKLAGIVSRGYVCKASDRGGLSTHTEIYKYYDWIIKNTGIKYYD